MIEFIARWVAIIFIALAASVFVFKQVPGKAMMIVVPVQQVEKGTT